MRTYLAVAAALVALAVPSGLRALPAYIGRIDLPVPGATFATAADLDGDLRLDLVAVSTSTNTLHVFYGRGDGTYRFPPETYPTDANPVYAVVGDLTNDGVTNLPDILVVTVLGTIPNPPGNSVSGDLAIYRNSGDPPGSAAPRFAATCQDLYLDGTAGQNGNQPRFALLGSVDGDNLLDIMASSDFGNSIQALFQGFSNNDSACAAPQACNFGWATSVGCTPTGTNGVNPSVIALGRFIPKVHAIEDLVSLNIPTNGAALVHYHFHANASRQPFTTLASHSYPVGDGVTTGRGATMMAADDLNGDTVPDLLVSAAIDGQVSVLRALDPSPPGIPPIFSSSTEYPAFPGPVWVATGDFQVGSLTGPARDAVVTNQAIDSIGILPGNGAAGFYNPACYPVGYSPRSVVVARLNSDSIDDLVIANQAGNSVTALLGRSTVNGGFDTAYRRRTSGVPVALAVGEFDGQPPLDVVAVNGDAATAVTLLGQANGTFEESSRPSSVAPDPVAAAAARFDVDSLDDVAVLSPTPGEVTVLLGVGDGSLRTASSFTVPDNATAVVAADFDGDRATDLVVAVPGLSAIELYRGAGNGTFGAGVETRVSGAAPGFLVAADLDANPAIDLAVLDATRSEVRILRNDGTGTFTVGAAIPTGATAASGLAAGDIDGDSDQDLVVTHADPAGSVVVLRGDGQGTFQALAPVGAGLPARSPLVGRLSAGLNRAALVLVPTSNLALIMPWNPGTSSLSLPEATGYGTGYAPVAAVGRSPDPGNPSLDTVIIADSSLPAEGYGITVLSAQRMDRYPPGDAGPDRAVCGTTPVKIGTPGKPYLDYIWTPPNGLDRADIPEPMASEGRTYTLTVFNPETQQSSTDSVTVTMSTIPSVTILPNPARYCSGDPPLRLDAGAGFASYEWSTGEWSQTIDVAPPSTEDFSVVVTNAGGCSGQGTRRVDVSDRARPVAGVTPTARCSSSTGPVTFTADASATQAPGGSTLSFAWSFVGSATGWTIATAAASRTDVSADPGAQATVKLRITVTTNPGGCTAMLDFDLALLPPGSRADTGNSLRAIKAPGGLELSWTANGSRDYTVYHVATKQEVATIILPANQLGAPITATTFPVLTTDSQRYYEVEGRCP